MLNEDGLQVDELVAIELPTAMRGYRQEDVDVLLDRVADALEVRNALLRTMTEDRDALLVELRQARQERDEARGEAQEGGERARQAVDEARRLRERVQSRAEALLEDAGRRADEIREQGRTEAAVLVSDGQARAREIVVDVERRRDQHEVELHQRWQTLEGELGATSRRADRARARLREELERHLGALDDWDDAAATVEGRDEPDTETGLDSRPPPFPPGSTEAVGPAPDGAPTDPDPAELAQLIGWDPHDLADLDTPFRLAADPDDRMTQ